MNNDELKKKIEGILQEEIEYVVVCGSSVKNVCIEHIADALIAAGIGDVKESENKATAAELVAQAAASTAIKKIAEWKYRAKVAEKALREACSRAWSIECTCPSIFEDNDECSECYKNQSEKRYEEKDAIGCLSKKLLEQAEKELAEERKDE